MENRIKLSSAPPNDPMFSEGPSVVSLGARHRPTPQSGSAPAPKPKSSAGETSTQTSFKDMLRLHDQEMSEALPASGIPPQPANPSGSDTGA
jgi:hypothetical protein